MNDTNITFGKEIQINNYQFLLPVIVDGVEMSTNDINFIIEPHKIGRELFYQQHIHIIEKFRHQGLGYRIYKSFIYEFGNIYSSHWCRTNHLEIPKIYEKLSKEKDFILIKTNKYFYVYLKDQN